MYVQILKLITARPLRSVTVISDFEPALTDSDAVFPEDAEGAFDLKALLTDDAPAAPLAALEDGALGCCTCLPPTLLRDTVSSLLSATLITTPARTTPSPI